MEGVGERPSCGCRRGKLAVFSTGTCGVSFRFGQDPGFDDRRLVFRKEGGRSFRPLKKGCKGPCHRRNMCAKHPRLFDVGCGIDGTEQGSHRSIPIRAGRKNRPHKWQAGFGERVCDWGAAASGVPTQDTFGAKPQGGEVLFTLKERKIVRNVCRQGDAYFRSGDLLRQDGLGFLYFCDRVGDTFRWKGENVSTSEVARALLECGGDKDNSSSTPLFSEAIVFGVEVPDNPGRAGMATVVMAPSPTPSTNGNAANDWQADLWRALQDELPRYAQPLFLRVTAEIEKTSTQKYKKTQLQKESFVDCGSDLVFLRDDTKRKFVELTNQVKDAVLLGTHRV